MSKWVSLTCSGFLPQSRNMHGMSSSPPSLCIWQVEINICGKTTSHFTGKASHFSCETKNWRIWIHLNKCCFYYYWASAYYFLKSSTKRKCVCSISTQTIHFTIIQTRQTRICIWNDKFDMYEDITTKSNQFYSQTASLSRRLPSSNPAPWMTGSCGVWQSTSASYKQFSTVLE